MFVVNDKRGLVDLHSHTLASDGYLSAEQLIERAAEKNVTMLAITDHDTTAAIADARRAIARFNLDLTLIAGVEISTTWQNHEIHILGLDIDADHSEMQLLLQQQSERRNERAEKISEKLAKAGIVTPLAGAKRFAAGAAITRSHFARYLIECGKANTMSAVFKHYLARGKTGYVAPEWCSIAEAIAAIHAAGGLAVVAHPSRYQLSNKWLKRLLAEFSEWGGDGMEVAHCQQPPDERQKLAEHADNFNLFASQGSDFHQPAPWCDLGKNLWLPKAARPIWEKFTSVTQPDLTGAEDL